MIKDETVFVVGAGASEPYGFPIGKELSERIINSLNNTNEMRKLYQEHTNQPALIQERGFNVFIERCNEFAKRFYYAHLYSIDHFLSTIKNEYQLIEIGKIAIVYQILLAEMVSPLKQMVGFKEDDWLSYLFNLING